MAVVSFWAFRNGHGFKAAMRCLSCAHVNFQILFANAPLKGEVPQQSQGSLDCTTAFLKYILVLQVNMQFIVVLLPVLRFLLHVTVAMSLFPRRQEFWAVVY